MSEVSKKQQDLVKIEIKGSEKAIAKGEDRLKLYKDLQSTYSDEGEAVMHASSVVTELISQKISCIQNNNSACQSLIKNLSELKL